MGWLFGSFVVWWFGEVRFTYVSSFLFKRLDDDNEASLDVKMGDWHHADRT